MSLRLACATAVAACAVSTTALAASAAPDCQPAIIRLSAIKPGKMTVFEKAVADQTAFYAAHGIPSYGKVVRVLEGPGVSATEAMTITIHPDAAKARAAPHDAGWDAFVAEFDDASTIKQETRVCLPSLAK